MAVAKANVTTGYTLAANAATAIGDTASVRRFIMISNLDTQITVFVAFGTGNAATSSVGHPIPPGQTMILGGTLSTAGISGPPVPVGDISAIAASGTPKIAVTLAG